MKQPKFFLIDAMAHIYRAYFAFVKNQRINSQGISTGSILGFANAVVEVVQKHKPTHIAVAFDTSAPTFRTDIYPPYKAHRQAQPEAITMAIPYIQEFLQALRIPYLAHEGYEADDIIGTIATMPGLQEFQIYLMTPDKDFSQLVDDHIYLYRPGIGASTTTIWKRKEVLEYWGIHNPKQVTDILGLWGDTSDNIPGVPKIGKKTAQKLIKEFYSIENLLQHTHDLKGSIKESLVQYREQALLSKQLAKICTNVPINFDISTSLYTQPDAEKLKKICNELDFRQLPKRLLGIEPNALQTTLFHDNKEATHKAAINNINTLTLATLATTPHTYHCLHNVEQVKKLAIQLTKQNIFALDTETTGLDPMQANLLGISIAYQPHQAYYIPCNNPDRLKIIQLLKPLLTDPTKTKVGQNLKYDLYILHQHHIDIQPPFFDTMVAHDLLEPHGRHGLNDMAVHYLAYAPIPIENLIGQKKKGSKQQCMSQVPLDKLTDYACEDADLTFQLYQKFKIHLLEHKLYKLFTELEMPLLPVLVAMERAGVAIDTTSLALSSADLQKDIHLLTQTIHKLAGSIFNIESPKQLGSILFESLALDQNPVKTKTGQYNTSQTILDKLTNKHPIIKQIIDYRQLKKLKSTYIDALPSLINNHTQRIHTSYHQTHVYTGRLSSTHPNLQNIPIRTEKGKSIRKAFVTSTSEHSLVSADYSQIELRLMAHFSKDEGMIHAFQQGKDIHSATACKIFQTDLASLTASMRRQAKMVNFGIIYGISAFGLAQRLEIPRKEASAIIEAYFKEFPRIKDYMQQTVQQVRSIGFITTLYGRKRFFPHINSRNATVRNMDERAAINMPIQGSAAELIKKAMIDVHAWYTQAQLPVKMIMQVHDELIFEVHNSALDDFTHHVKSLMQDTLTLKVPIVVDLGIGKNWFEAH